MTPYFDSGDGRRDIAWLLRDGYRLYCRYCETPHKSRDAAMKERCCKQMQLDDLRKGADLSDVPIGPTKKRKTPDEAARALCTALLEGLYKEAARHIIARDKRGLVNVLREYKNSPACEIVRLRLNMTFEEQIKPLMDWQWGAGVPDELRAILLPRKPAKKPLLPQDGA